MVSFTAFSAITAFVDPAVDFALQFQVDGELTAMVHEDAAENDGQTIEQEDGSNVVNVDFGKKN